MTAGRLQLGIEERDVCELVRERTQRVAAVQSVIEHRLLSEMMDDLPKYGIGRVYVYPSRR